MKILGIDPGTTIMGFALIEVQNKEVKLLTMGVVKLSKFQDHYTKLKKIFEKTLGLIEYYHPEILAVEAPFYGKNPQSMLKLGRAQGIVIAVSLSQSLSVFEYSPRKIKQSITGNGNASKEQVAAMLKNMKLFVNSPSYLDATDALAVAVCHHLQNRINVTGTKYNSWKNFLSENEDRIFGG